VSRIDRKPAPHEELDRLVIEAGPFELGREGVVNGRFVLEYPDHGRIARAEHEFEHAVLVRLKARA
jgi:hypothetical protein